MMLSVAVLTQYRHVLTDTSITNTQTLDDCIHRASMAARGNNQNKLNRWSTATRLVAERESFVRSEAEVDDAKASDVEERRGDGQ